MAFIQKGLLLLSLLLPLATQAVEKADVSLQLPAGNDKKAAAVTFSARYKSLSIERAYQLQKAYVRNRVSHGVKMVGFKAGLTTQAAQQKFALNVPITGVLIEPPLQGDNITLELSDAHTLLVEQELAFRIAVPVTHKIKSVEQLKTHIDAVAPAIELPDMNFVAAEFTGLDIIANNAMVHKLILGQWAAADQDIEHIDVSLYCDDQLIASGVTGSLQNGQWKMLLWMVNHLLEQGYMLQPGQVLLTGATAGMHSAAACHYTADFAALGQIRFRVE